MASGPPPNHLAFVVPGDLGTLTGGYGYDRQVIAGLRAMGWTVDVLALPGGFPWPDAAALHDAGLLLAGLADGTRVVADGLAFCAMPGLAEQHARRLHWLALVHHPLAAETGLSAMQQDQLFRSEQRALATAHRVIVTGPATARALARYGVAADRIHVVLPGTAPAPVASGSPAGQGLNLLCVATLIPRKGHAVLVEALAGLQDRAWTLHCVGSTTRHPATADVLRSAIDRHGLAQRVLLHGEVPDAALAGWYDRADAFVLATYHEGYGMALAEALARGLPVISSRTEAIAHTVPPDAGVLLAPGDVAALRAALARLLDDAPWRQRLATGARAARSRLPTWNQAVARFAQAVGGTQDGAVAGTERAGSR